MKHTCQESNTCCCSVQGLEPNERCPIHGAGEWPPRCGYCGKFLPWVKRQAEVSNLLNVKEN